MKKWQNCKKVVFGRWEKADENHTVARFCDKLGDKRRGCETADRTIVTSDCSNFSISP